jgi:PAS domain S-box-containing protein
MAQAGFDEGYVKVVDATWADTPRGARPAGAAIRTGKTQIVDDIATDPRFEPLRAEPLARGYRSAIALPLHMNAYIRGALTIYAPLPDAFDGEAASLLTKLAEDLAFGIAALRMRKARDQAELDLKESAEKLRAITEAAQDAVILVDARGAIVYWNSAAVRIFGYSTEVAFGQDLHKFLPPPADQTDAAKGFARFAETGQGPILGRTLELTALRNGGGEFPVEVSVGAVKLGGQWCAVGIVRDITERKRAEAERQLHIETERQAIVNTVQAIALTIEKRDPYTAGHERRVADLGVAIAREMRLPESQVEGLYMAGLIHDVGKIEVPAEILSRPGALSPAQFALVKTHCQAGYDIIKDIPTPWPLAAVALQHHERLDGSGYPNGLKGDDICIEARIMAVADVVEAMMSHRPYRAALGIDAALTEITAGRGTRFDAAAVDACIALFREKGFAFPAAGTKPVFAGRYTSLR